MLGARDATPRQSFKSCAICSLPRTINICPRYVTAPTDRLLENVWNLNQSFISDVIAAHRDTHANMNLLFLPFFVPLILQNTFAYCLFSSCAAKTALWLGDERSAKPEFANLSASELPVLVILLQNRQDRQNLQSLQGRVEASTSRRRSTRTTVSLFWKLFVPVRRLFDSWLEFRTEITRVLSKSNPYLAREPSRSWQQALASGFINLWLFVSNKLLTTVL